MIRQQFYGWFDAKARVFRLSRYPADAPVRPSTEFATKADLMALIERKKARVMWWPPLPEGAS